MKNIYVVTKETTVQSGDEPSHIKSEMLFAFENIITAYRLVRDLKAQTESEYSDKREKLLLKIKDKPDFMDGEELFETLVSYRLSKPRYEVRKIEFKGEK